MTHYCISDVVLTTKAENVVLPRTHIDVLQGPEQGRLLYIGKAKEQRLKLRSFAKQLEDVARRSNNNSNEHVTSGQTPPEYFMQENKSESGVKTVTFTSAPRYKCHLTVQGQADQPAQADPPIRQDGKCFVGSENWQSLVETEYLTEPMADQNYVTTGALAASQYALAGDKPEQPVAILDLAEKVRKWMGGDTWMCAICVCCQMAARSGEEVDQGAQRPLPRDTFEAQGNRVGQTHVGLFG